MPEPTSDNREFVDVVPPLNPLRPSFITPEMIERNPVLEVAGLFAGDPIWEELREEIRRNRELDRQIEEQENK